MLSINYNVDKTKSLTVFISAVNFNKAVSFHFATEKVQLPILVLPEIFVDTTRHWITLHGSQEGTEDTMHYQASQLDIVISI